MVVALLTFQGYISQTSGRQLYQVERVILQSSESTTHYFPTHLFRDYFLLSTCPLLGAHFLAVSCYKHMRLSQRLRYLNASMLTWGRQVYTISGIEHYPTVPKPCNSSLCTRFSIRANLILESDEEASKELKLFKLAGGGAVCDVTTLGIRTKPEVLPRVSQETGLKIITGTGFYVGTSLSEETQSMSIPEVIFAGTIILPHTVINNIMTWPHWKLKCSPQSSTSSYLLSFE